MHTLLFLIIIFSNSFFAKKKCAYIIYILYSWGFLVPPSQIYLLINDTANTIALYSTVKFDGVPIYHLSLGVSANVP